MAFCFPVGIFETFARTFSDFAENSEMAIETVKDGLRNLRCLAIGHGLDHA